MGGAVSRAISWITQPFHTKRYTTVQIQNNFGEELEYIHVKHKYGRAVHSKTWNQTQLHNNDKMNIWYKTGVGSKWDVWYVKWKTMDTEYEYGLKYYINPYWNNGWKQCYLTKSDANGPVTIAIHSYYRNGVEIIPYYSGSASTNWSADPRYLEGTTGNMLWNFCKRSVVQIVKKLPFGQKLIDIYNKVEWFLTEHPWGKYIGKGLSLLKDYAIGVAMPHLIGANMLFKYAYNIYDWCENGVSKVLNKAVGPLWDKAKEWFRGTSFYQAWNEKNIFGAFDNWAGAKLGQKKWMTMKSIGCGTVAGYIGARAIGLPPSVAFGAGLMNGAAAGYRCYLNGYNNVEFAFFSTKKETWTQFILKHTPALLLSQYTYKKGTYKAPQIEFGEIIDRGMYCGHCAQYCGDDIVYERKHSERTYMKDTGNKEHFGSIEWESTLLKCPGCGGDMTTDCYTVTQGNFKCNNCPRTLQETETIYMCYKYCTPNSEFTVNGASQMKNGCGICENCVKTVNKLKYACCGENIESYIGQNGCTSIKVQACTECGENADSVGCIAKDKCSECDCDMSQHYMKETLKEYKVTQVWWYWNYLWDNKYSNSDLADYLGRLQRYNCNFKPCEYPVSIDIRHEFIVFKYEKGYIMGVLSMGEGAVRCERYDQYGFEEAVQSGVEYIDGTEKEATIVDTMVLDGKLTVKALMSKISEEEQYYDGVHHNCKHFAKKMFEWSKCDA
eukprot:29826_1